jgi:hypothetical protein
MGAPGVYLERACREQKLAFARLTLPEAACIQDPAQFSLYFRVDHMDYTDDLPVRLRPAVFWIFDAHMRKPFQALERQLPHYDLVFCTNRLETEWFRRRGLPAFWIPFACDPEIHGVTTGGVRDLDVAYVGRDGGVLRKFLLQAVKERYERSFIGMADHEAIKRIYSRAKICINYTRYEGHHGMTRGIVSMRVFEGMAAGALMITNRVEDRGLEELGFLDRRELVVVDTPTQLMDAIAAYIRNTPEREAIASRGQTAVLSQHTYVHRLRAMTELIAKHMHIVLERPLVGRRMETTATRSRAADGVGT